MRTDSGNLERRYAYTESTFRVNLTCLCAFMGDGDSTERRSTRKVCDVHCDGTRKIHSVIFFTLMLEKCSRIFVKATTHKHLFTDDLTFFVTYTISYTWSYIDFYLSHYFSFYSVTLLIILLDIFAYFASYFTFSLPYVLLTCNLDNYPTSSLCRNLFTLHLDCLTYDLT